MVASENSTNVAPLGAVLFCTVSQKNITDPKRRASVAQPSVGEVCGYS